MEEKCLEENFQNGRKSLFEDFKRKLKKFLFMRAYEL